ERPPGGVAEGKVAEEEARYAAALDDIERATHHDRRDAIRLEVTRHQSHRLIPDGTVRHEQCEGGVECTRTREYLRRVLFHRHALAAIGRHADHALRESTDSSLSNGLEQARDR